MIGYRIVCWDAKLGWHGPFQSWPPHWERPCRGVVHMDRDPPSDADRFEACAPGVHCYRVVVSPRLPWGFPVVELWEVETIGPVVIPAPAMWSRGPKTRAQGVRYLRKLDTYVLTVE